MKKLIYAAIVLFVASCSGGKTTTQESTSEDQAVDSSANVMKVVADSLSVETDSTMTELDTLSGEE